MVEAVQEVRGVHIGEHALGAQCVFELGIKVVGGREEQFDVHDVGGCFVDWSPLGLPAKVKTL